MERFEELRACHSCLGHLHPWDQADTTIAQKKIKQKGKNLDGLG